MRLLSLLFTVLLLAPPQANADFVLDMTLCRPPQMKVCEQLQLLAHRSVWACHIGAPRIVAKVETMNPSAKWRLKTYKCRDVPKGTSIR